MDLPSANSVVEFAVRFFYGQDLNALFEAFALDDEVKLCGILIRKLASRERSGTIFSGCRKCLFVYGCLETGFLCGLTKF